MSGFSQETCRRCGAWLSRSRLVGHEAKCTGGKGRPNLSPKSHTLKCVDADSDSVITGAR